MSAEDRVIIWSSAHCDAVLETSRRVIIDSLKQQEVRIAALIEAGETLWHDVKELSQGRMTSDEWDVLAQHGKAFERAKEGVDS